MLQEVGGRGSRPGVEVRMGLAPVSHDVLFKWLISELVPDFFGWYFKGVEISDYTVIDKEFYEAYAHWNNNSQEGDLFLAVEVIIDGKPQEVVILIEHKSKREDIKKQLITYFCYALLLRCQPVWLIAFFTDDALWRKKMDQKIWCSVVGGVKQYIRYDIIKVNEQMSSELIAQKSLFCKLLALKANDKNCHREDLIRDIYQTVRELEDTLNDHRKMLVEQFIDAYRKVPEKVAAQIKEEVEVAYVASNIIEHYEMIAEKRGEKLGEKRGVKLGEKRGKREGETLMLKSLLARGLITKEVYDAELKAIENRAKQEKAP